MGYPDVIIKVNITQFRSEKVAPLFDRNIEHLLDGMDEDQNTVYMGYSTVLLLNCIFYPTESDHPYRSLLSRSRKCYFWQPYIHWMS